MTKLNTHSCFKKKIPVGVVKENETSHLRKKHL